MNLVLLQPSELSADGAVELTDARARHLCSVLDVRPGSRVRVGILDGPLGDAEVHEVAVDRVRLHCRFEATTPERSADTLLLAMPRPRVLRRCLEHATALGFGRIVLLRSWCVDKSHIGSKALLPEQVHLHLCAGLEQARRTRLPLVSIFDRFKPFVEDHLDEIVPANGRFVAHPTTDTPIREARPNGDALALAIGPERGWIHYEIELLAAHGFTPVHAGRHPQRVETALPWLYGQLCLLRQLA